MMSDTAITKSGYIDVKQPAKIKGRKLKSWKKKWVTIQQMSNLSAGTFAAKVDVYADEKTATSSPTDKTTFILEHVTDIKPAKSKTHTYAMEVVEKDPVLLLAGGSELETQSWVWVFRRIFWPDRTDSDTFTVQIVTNQHAARQNLHGIYQLRVTPECIRISSETESSYEWPLSMLKRFHVEKDEMNEAKEVISIECGPKCQCGEAKFQFRSENVADILAAIKENIFLAINRKKAAAFVKKLSNADQPQMEGDIGRNRTSTVSSTEQGFKDLLESHGQMRLRTDISNVRSSRSNSESAVSVSSDSNVETPPVVEETSPKQRLSVTFKPPVIEEQQSDIARPNIDDMLSVPSEIHTPKDRKTRSSDYNRVEFVSPKSPPTIGNIISTFTVARPGYQTKVLLDDTGYSHVELKNNVPQIKDIVKVKSRSLSNTSHSSSFSRSASVGSGDSGILFQASDKDKCDVKCGTLGNRSTNSFDSAVSTSSTVDKQVNVYSVVSNPEQIHVEIQEIVMNESEFTQSKTVTEDNVDINEDNNGCSIYQDVSIDEDSCDNLPRQSARPVFLKSNSTGNFRENEYEELEKYQKGKKDLVKHLGMDPKVDPSSIPPALPDRPRSHKVKRKHLGNNKDKKTFTLPFVKHKSKKGKETASSCSSESDSESASDRSDKKAEGISTVRSWPLGCKSAIVGNNQIYQPISIERYLNDNEETTTPNLRKRSSSLNLNRIVQLKRTPTELAARNAEKSLRKSNKHHRNASMNLNVNRNEDQEFTDFDTASGNMTQTSYFLGQYGNNRQTSVGKGTCSRTIELIDEPIYAEVIPDDGHEDPFPHMEEWKPINVSADILDVTPYENADSDSELNDDPFNAGFLTGEDNVNSADKTSSESNVPTSEALLIDIFAADTNEHSSNVNVLSPTTRAVDIFNLQNNTFLDTNGLNTTNTNKISTNVSTVVPEFVDIFKLGINTTLPQSRMDLQSSAYDNKWCDITKHKTQPVVDTSNNWADFSRFELASGPNVTNMEQTLDPLYMDMSSRVTESIYVMPSDVKK